MTPDRMAAIHTAAFQTQRPWTSDEFSDLLKANSTQLTSVDDNCFALARIIADEAEVLTIASHPDWQRQGLARSCLFDLIADCNSRGCAKLFLEVDSSNLAALRLYEGTGFVATGKRPNYYRHPDGTRCDAIIMQKEHLRKF